MGNQFFFNRDVYIAEIFQDFTNTVGSSGYSPQQINESAILLFSLDTNGIIVLLEGKILTLLGIEKKKFGNISF